MIDLKKVTLWGCCWSDDRSRLDKTIRVLNYCRSLANFGAIILFAKHQSMRKPIDAKVVQIPGLDFSGFNIFATRIVPLAITTDYAMSVHEDGFIINPGLWRDEFLAYDYIGAPWPNGNVGNGGFCIESRKFMEAKQQLPFDSVGIASDIFVCDTHRSKLLDAGLTYAPKEVALRFSTELTDGNKASFGFHGRNGVCRTKYEAGWLALCRAGF